MCVTFCNYSTCVVIQARFLYCCVAILLIWSVYGYKSLAFIAINLITWHNLHILPTPYPSTVLMMTGLHMYLLMFIEILNFSSGIY